MVRSRAIAFCVAVLASTASAFAPTRAAASASPAARSTGLHSLKRSVERSVDELRYNAMMNFVGVLFGGDSTGGVLPNAAPPSRRRAAAAAPAPPTRTAAPANLVEASDTCVVSMVPELSALGKNQVLHIPSRYL
jgi:hypothetical protein